MPIPKACPVCSTDKLEPIMRKPLSSSAEGESLAVSGVYAYRCVNGHVFLAWNDEAKAKNAGAE